MTAKSSPSLAAYCAAVEARVSAATPGPWTLGYDDGSGRWDADERSFCIVGAEELPVLHTEIAHRETDALLIAHAPTDLTRLLQIVRTLSGALERILERGEIHHEGTVVLDCEAEIAQATLAEAERLARGGVMELVYMNKQGVLWLASPGLAVTEGDGIPVEITVESSNPDAVFELLKHYGMECLGDL